MRLPIRTRLVLGFSAIILLVGGAAAYLLFAMRDVSRAMDEIRRDGAIVRDSLSMASSLFEQYAHEAHVLLLPEPEGHVAHFELVVKNTRNCLARLRGATEPLSAERGLVERIADEAERFRTLFHEELLPAFQRGDRARALDVHHHSEELIQDVVRRNDELSGRLLARIDRTQHRAEGLVGRAMKVGAGALLGLIALAAAIAAYLVRAIHGPIAALVRGTRAVAAGDLEAKIALEGPDEFGALASSFNEMTTRLRANQQELVSAERLASLGQLAAGVAHQMNNPLGVIVGYAAVLTDPRYDERAREKAIASIRREAEECRAVVANLLALARPGSLELVRVDVTDLVESVIEKARRYASFEGVRVELALPREAPPAIETDRRKLEQALLNLVVNAVEAMPAGGRLLVEARVAEGVLGLAVADSGKGLGSEERKRLFEPYFTTKPTGTGLGLAFAYGLIRALGGKIEVASSLGSGARFEIRLPLVHADDPRRTEP